MAVKSCSVDLEKLYGKGYKLSSGATAGDFKSLEETAKKLGATTV